MRVAIALPNMPPGAAHGVALRSVVEALVAIGLDIEVFSERHRLGESTPGLACFHYLRLPERHRCCPFDAAIYPLGRDCFPFEAAFWLMKRFPGVAWILDPVPHHLLLGGVALRGHWHGYGKALEESYPGLGPAIAHTVATGWGTASLYRRYDLAAAVAGDQVAALAAWPALAAQMRAQLGRCEVLPLPLVQGAVVGADPGSPQSDKQIAFLSVNPAWPGSAAAAATEVLHRHPEARITICSSAPTHHLALTGPIGKWWSGERVEWVVDPDWDRLAAVAQEAGTLVWLREDLLAGERVLLTQALAAGKLVMVPRSSLYDDLPEGVTVKVDPGRALPLQLAEAIDQLLSDKDLRDGVQQAARSWARGAPSSRQVAGVMKRILEAEMSAATPQLRPISEPTWRAVSEEFLAAALPPGAGASVRRRIMEAAQALDLTGG
ncbi:MAG: glycosyltransferase [Acidobacteriota bacterium]